MTRMTDGINVTINIEELHLHYPDVESDVPLDVDVADMAGVSPTEGPATADEPADRDTPASYDIRDKPTTGVVLLEAAESDGVAPKAIAEMHGLNQNTVSTAMRKMYERRALDRVDRVNGMPFYALTDFGERVLDDYRERWSRGLWKLPKDYWEGVPTRGEQKNAA